MNSPKIVQKYLAPSPATSKGRLKKQQANVRTTRLKIKLEGEVPSDDDFADIAPTNTNDSNAIEDSHSASNVFC